MASAAIIGLTGCTEPAEVPRDELPFDPSYLGAEAQALDADLVQIDVKMSGARDAQDVADYADCAIAGYADARGFGFVRHLRTQVNEDAGIWQGDAVYTMSPALPAGAKTIDAVAQADACLANAIPQL